MTTGAARLARCEGVIRWVRTTGTGHPVAYLHGLGCSSLASWAETAARLGRPGLFVDLVGHGLSDRPATFGHSLPEQADAVAAALTASGRAPVDLLAHSLGGSVAVVLADRYPHLLRSLVLVEPGLDPAPVGPGHPAAQDEEDLARGGWERLLEQEDPERRAEVRTADPLALVRGARAVTDALGGTLNDVLLRTRVPTLLVAGQRDYERWQDLRAAGIRCERVTDGGHAVMREQPGWFHRLVEDFTAGAGAPATAAPPHPPSASGHLGAFDGLRDVLARSWPLFGEDAPDPATVRHRLRAALGVPVRPTVAEADLTVHQRWTRDGLEGAEVSWDAGFGPRVRGRVLRPAGRTGPLPGALFLHCHGGIKSFGLDKLADGADGRPVHDLLVPVRDTLYGGRAPAEDLARRGFHVLVHDGFGWGSRRTPLSALPARSTGQAAAELAVRHARGERPDEAATYDLHAGPAEDAVAKALGVLGTSWAGMLAREDLLALELLAADPGVAAGGVGVLGLSGGGARAAITAALAREEERLAGTVGAVVVAAMVATLEEVLPEHLHCHTWALMTPGLGRVADWPQIVAAGVPTPLLVQFAARDALFPAAGADRARQVLAAAYATAPGSFRGTVHDVPHSFGRAQQDEAHDWLARHLPAGPSTAQPDVSPPGGHP
ncbi:alpha/beta fold hydrolase [Kineococcus sp. LSe6-4]|uniref:Alpha/beta fold hydrolase n=1 Tax=Kineococcus halophytocola TaxID=3234027 RepID=A0ABV4GY86_9ACTN